jgi:phage-related protein
MASRIAEAYVQIVPRIDGIGKSLSKGLSGEMGKAGQESGKGFAGGFKKILGPAVALAATAAIGNFVKGAILAAEEVATANARLGQINESMGLFGDQTSAVTDRLIKYAEANEQTLATDAEVIKGTQAKLLTFKELAATADVTGGAFDRATAAAVDLAAAGFGSAESNAVQLGKALNDPVKGIAALNRSGITFTEVEKEKIKSLTESGQILEAQNLVLAAIESQVGGTAAATANYSDRVKLAFDNLKETVGASLAPAFETLAKALIPVVNDLGPVLANVFEKLAPVFVTVANVLPTVGKIIESLAPILGLVFEAFAQIIDAALPVFIELLDELMPVIESLLPPVIDLVKALLPIIPALLQIALAFIPLIQTIIPILTSAIKFLTPIILFLANALSKTLKFAVDVVIGVMNGIIGVIQTVLKWFGQIGTAIFESGRKIFNFFKGLLPSILNVITAPGKWLFQVGKDIIKGLIDGITGAAKNIGSFFSDIGKKAIQGFKDIFGIKSPSKVMKGFGKDIMKGLEQGLLAGESSIRSTMKKVSSWITSAVKDGVIGRATAKQARELIGNYRKQLIGLQRDLDAVNEKLGNAQADLAERLNERLNFIQSLSQKYGASLQLDESTTAQSAIEFLRKRLAATKQLAAVSDKLIEMGLNKDLYKQIIEAGAIDFAASIIEGGQAAVEELNVLADQANAEAKKLATQVGDILFNEGIVFAQSVVDGLLSEKATIEEMMRSIAAAFAAEINALISAAVSAMNGVQASAQATATTASKAATTANKAAKTAAKAPAPAPSKTVADTFFATKKALNQIGSTVSKAVPGALSWKPFAKGGFVSGPTRALIGEAGPEVVYPLKDFERMMGLDGGRGNTLIYNAAPNNSIDREQALLQAIKRAKVITGW